MGEWLTFTFALTGRRNGEHGTRGVAPGYELTGLSARTGPQIGLWHRGAVASLPTLIFQDFEHPTCKGKSMGKWLAFTFALSGRRNGVHGTQGVALGYELAGLSARTEPQREHSAKV